METTKVSQDKKDGTDSNTIETLKPSEQPIQIVSTKKETRREGLVSRTSSIFRNFMGTAETKNPDDSLFVEEENSLLKERNPHLSPPFSSPVRAASSPPSQGFFSLSYAPFSPSSKEESKKDSSSILIEIRFRSPLGALQVSVTTIFSESLSFVIDASSESSDLLENIQLQLQQLSPLNLKSESSTEGNTSPSSQKNTSSKPYIFKSTPMMKELHVASTPPFDFYLNRLPDEICSQLTLQTLVLTRHDLPYLPPHLAQLLSLEKLSLSHNKIKALPQELRCLTALQDLNVAHNLLTYLPPFQAFTSLHTLNVNHNQLTALPDLSDLVSLQSLNAQHNRISASPSGLHLLTSLKYLDLSHNSLTLLLDKKTTLWLPMLSRLELLKLHHNKLSSFTSSVEGLFALRVLDLSYNSLPSLPPSLDTLTALKELNVSHNALTVIPEELAKLQLTHLSLDHNKLTSLVSLQEMTSLSHLSLSFNSLCDLSFWERLPPSLQYINISQNIFPTIPPSPSPLPHLTTLNLSHNALTSLSPEFFAHLPKLKILNLSDNSLTSLPPSLSSLPSIETLDLSNNCLEELPLQIQQMSSLKDLFLHSSKQLLLPTSLPPQLNQLSVVHHSINRNKSEVRQIDEGEVLPKLFKEFLEWVRLAPHPLGVYALWQFAQHPDYRPLFAVEKIHGDLVEYLKDASLALEATQALTVLYKYSEEESELFSQLESERLLNLMKTGPPKLQVEAAECLATVCLSLSAKEIFVNGGGLEIVYESHSSSDERVRRAANVLLNTVGAHDLLHFPPSRTRGVRILALDGGGIRALATLEVLKKIEEISGRRISESFDIIAGTSTGGVLGTMLGIRGYSLERCETLYKDFSTKVFFLGSSGGEADPSSWSRLVNYSNLLTSGAFYKSGPLTEALALNCGSEPLIETTGDDRVAKLKVMLVTTLTSTVPPQVHLFRNYCYLPSSPSRYIGDCRARICDALRASTAAPSYFSEYVDARTGEKHQDGAIVANNPTALAIHEAKKLWPTRPIECVVSVGTGTSPPLPVPRNKSFLQVVLTTLVKAATSPDRIHDALTDLLGDTSYFRFQPSDPVYGCQLDETNEEVLKLLQERTKEDLKEAENVEKLSRLAEILKHPLYS